MAARIRFGATSATINSAGIEVDELGVAASAGSGSRRRGRDRPSTYSARARRWRCSGARCSTIGGLDPSFFAYLEDADLAWRARMAGWRCVLAPRAVVPPPSAPPRPRLEGEASPRRPKPRTDAREERDASQLLRCGLAMVLYDLSTSRSSRCGRGSSLRSAAAGLHGLREWRTYRTAGESQRRRTRLVPSPGIRAALLRDQAYG